ncbi:MAG: hypothetical protein MZW92_37890 [Comamonadaceae bacterium]|nr:hypothetical protein [Comamonadaceae bacterium]
MVRRRRPARPDAGRRPAPPASTSTPRNRRWPAIRSAYDQEAGAAGRRPARCC